MKVCITQYCFVESHPVVVVIMFSGGIGITPWLSIVRDYILRKDAKHKPKQMYLHSSFRSRSEMDAFSGKVD
jgi:ferredoxin-NADP reductase